MMATRTHARYARCSDAPPRLMMRARDMFEANDADDYASFIMMRAFFRLPIFADARDAIFQRKMLFSMMFRAPARCAQHEAMRQRCSQR